MTTILNEHQYHRIVTAICETGDNTFSILDMGRLLSVIPHREQQAIVRWSRGQSYRELGIALHCRGKYARILVVKGLRRLKIAQSIMMRG